MKVLVRFFADLREFAPAGKTDGGGYRLELAPQSRIADLLAQLKIPPSRIKVIFVNGRARDLDYHLHDEDEVGLFPPVGGG